MQALTTRQRQALRRLLARVLPLEGEINSRTSAIHLPYGSTDRRAADDDIVVLRAFDARSRLSRGHYLSKIENELAAGICRKGSRL